MRKRYLFFDSVLLSLYLILLPIVSDFILRKSADFQFFCNGLLFLLISEIWFFFFPRTWHEIEFLELLLLNVWFVTISVAEIVPCSLLKMTDINIKFKTKKIKTNKQTKPYHNHLAWYQGVEQNNSVQIHNEKESLLWG